MKGNRLGARAGLAGVTFFLALAQGQVKDYAVRPAPIASVHIAEKF